MGCKAKIEVDPSAQPRYCKARTLPYAMRPQVEEELERLVTEGILEPVAHSEWGTPIVAALKSDKKTIRLCGDFRMIVNPVAKLDRYLVPRVEDLFATLTQGHFFFTKLDFLHAYQRSLWMKTPRSTSLSTLQRAYFDTPASLSAYHRPQPFFRERWSTYSRASQGWWCRLMTSWLLEKMRQVIGDYTIFSRNFHFFLSLS